MAQLFPFAEYWWFYAGFIALVIGLLALDLGVFHRKAHVVSFRESATWSVVWITLALIFNAAFYYYALQKFPPDVARSVGMEFLTGYVIEKALAVDNLFVFVVVFSYFRIPALYQHRVLFYGILGALIFRAIFIALGSALLSISWVAMAAGAFLVFTGIKLLFTGDNEIDPANNPALRLVRRVIPVTDKMDGSHFFTRIDGKLFATPLFLALIIVEFSDIIFAIDSVPAIFAITKEPLIVFTSNIFAILGLRSLYFMLAGVMDKFHLLKYGLGLILVFVGLKMAWLNEHFGGKFPIGWSLAIIFGILAASIIASLVIKPKPKAPEA